MGMNLCHRWCCSSRYWARTVARDLLPWALAGIDLGDNALEIGPGYGANLQILVAQSANLTCVEIDPSMAARLQSRYGNRARVIHADGTATGLADGVFSSVVCFTMLHHLLTLVHQDACSPKRCGFSYLAASSPAATGGPRPHSGSFTSVISTTQIHRPRCAIDFAGSGSSMFRSRRKAATFVGGLSSRPDGDVGSSGMPGVGPSCAGTGSPHGVSRYPRTGRCWISLSGKQGTLGG